jgi:hypothetical protein
MKAIGANTKAAVESLDELPGKVNYFIGNDPKKWHSNIPTFKKVAYRDLYKGIDLVYYGTGRKLEYDFVVKPGGDPSKIALSFTGAKSMRVASSGDLVLGIDGGDVVWRKPAVYQMDTTGKRSPVAGSYVLAKGGEVRFTVAAYDVRRPLVIDPVLEYATYLGGGSGDAAAAIALDGSGSVYVTGTTFSPNFPVTAGAVEATYGGDWDDVFVSKLSPSGDSLVYSTYLGSSNRDSGGGIAVDGSGSAYVTGITFSPDFPITAGVAQGTPGGGGDVFVAKLNPSGGSLIYSTYLGGINRDIDGGIAVDASGSAYVTGYTNSLDFPVTGGAAQRAPGGDWDAFAAKLSPSGGALVYATYLGGSGLEYGWSIAVDASGSAYVTGRSSSSDFPVTVGTAQGTFGGGGGSGDGGDAFVAKLSPTGDSLIYSTYLGGSDRDDGTGIAVDAAGSAYVAGSTSSTNFPVTIGSVQGKLGGGADAFVAKLSPTGGSLDYSTYLGGVHRDAGVSIAVDVSGNAYVTGTTFSPDFPVTASAAQLTIAGGYDAFVAKVNPSGGSLLYSTCFGGSGGEGANSGVADAAGSVYVTGGTDSADFPATAGAAQGTIGGAGDAFVAKLDISQGILSITTLSPPEVTVGTTAFDVVLVGVGFETGATIVVGNTAIPTTRISATKIAAKAPASLAANVGQLVVYVANSGPIGGGASNTKILRIINSSPAISSLFPMAVVAGSAAFTLTVTGTGFVPASTMTIGGTALTATYVNATTLTVNVSASLVTTPNSLAVVVTNPAPGGGVSPDVTLTVAVSLPLAASPVIAPKGGTFATPQPVTMTDATPGAKIYFTTDGTSPTAASTLYNAPFTLSATRTINAIALANGYANSTVTSAVFKFAGPSYAAGINFFSSPYDYPGIALDTLFGYTGVKLAVWSPTANVYAVTPTSPAGELRLGVGYWARFPKAVTMTAIGAAADTTKPFTINLAAGWNQVGDPFAKAVTISSLTFGAGTSFAAATTATSPLVSPTVWGYDSTANSGSGGYVLATSLQPLKGYWMYAFKATTMTVPAP